MNLDDYIVASIDIEATGLDTTRDRILTIGVVKHTPGLLAAHLVTKDWREWKFNPLIPIPKESTAVHGITDADVAGLKPLLKTTGDEIAAFLSDCQVLTGYNVRGFDVPMLVEELERVGSGGKFPPKDALVIDAQTIFKLKEKRDLNAAVLKFCGREHKDAHSALADAVAALDVLRGELEHYSDLAAMSGKELASWTGMDKVVDWSGVLERREDGVVVYTHRKVKGIPVMEDVGYAEWLLRNNFSADTKSHIRAILDAHYNEGGGE